MEKSVSPDKKPYKAQKRTYLQGTVLRLFNHHCENNDLKDAEYIRSLVIQDLKARYEINNTGGIVKIKR